jgi:uncharacterized Fe-S cluster-containing radical SAM superfamily protein
MRYKQIIKVLKDEKFRRLTGVKPQTFEKMVNILRLAHQEKKARGGRKNKLTIEDQLLMALEYLREYRTYFHVSQSYGVSESNAYKIIRWIEEHSLSILNLPCLVKKPYLKQIGTMK